MVLFWGLLLFMVECDWFYRCHICPIIFDFICLYDSCLFVQKEVIVSHLQPFVAQALFWPLWLTFGYHCALLDFVWSLSIWMMHVGECSRHTRPTPSIRGEGCFYPMVFAAAAKLPGGLVQVLNQSIVPYTVLFSAIALEQIDAVRHENV